MFCFCKCPQSWLLTFSSLLCSMMNLNENLNDESQHNPSFLDRHRNKAALKIETFKATAAMCKFNARPLFIFTWLETFLSNHTTLRTNDVIDGKTILAFCTLYSVTVFSLNLSWNLTTADVSSEMLHVLEIMTVLLHAIFFLCSFFMWVFVSVCYFLEIAG